MDALEKINVQRTLLYIKKELDEIASYAQFNDNPRDSMQYCVAKFLGDMAERGLIAGSNVAVHKYVGYTFSSKTRALSFTSDNGDVFKCKKSFRSLRHLRVFAKNAVKNYLHTDVRISPIMPVSHVEVKIYVNAK